MLACALQYLVDTPPSAFHSQVDRPVEFGILPRSGVDFHKSVTQAPSSVLEPSGLHLWIPGIRLASASSSRTAGDVSILRLNERYADTGKVGFIGYHRNSSFSTDAGTHPILNLTQHA